MKETSFRHSEQTMSLPGCIAILLGLFCVIEVEVIVWLFKVIFH